MIKLFFIALLLSYSTAVSHAQETIHGLPDGAFVLETRQLVAAKRPNRVLVLWMVKPKRNPRDSTNEVYSCPEYTRGSYYSGPTRVSLYDASNKTILNTLKIVADYDDNADSYDLPYAIRPGYYYQVAASSRKGAEGKPSIMSLKDYNGDGKALEFALFDALACMGLETTLIGYSEKLDRVVQYPIDLTMTENGRRSRHTLVWADYLMTKKPIRPQYWKYEIDYRGRGGSLDKYEIRYNPLKEVFEGTRVSVADEP